MIMYRKLIILFLYINLTQAAQTNQNDLVFIGADDAHAQNITGSGIRVGVVDGAANSNHPSLNGQIADQIYSTYNSKTYTPDFLADTHGSHVTSIILGKNLGSNNPRGVAYDAKSYNVQITGYNVIGKATFINPNIYDYFVKNDVKVINNSWNSTIYPFIGMNGVYHYPSYSSNDSNEWLKIVYSQSTASKNLADLSKENRSLVVFASGNEGMSSPGISSVLPSFDEDLRSWLNIGALDISHITKDSNNKLKISSLGVPVFSNGFKGATNYSLMAPGNFVVGANASYGVRDEVFGKVDKNLYIAVSGTSQATPYVSGAAALIMQKFSFLKPNQVADVLLSTANKDYIAPKVVLKQTKAKVPNDTKTAMVNKVFYTLFYIDNKIPKKADGTVDMTQVQKDIQEAYKDSNDLDLVYYFLTQDRRTYNEYQRIEDYESSYPWLQEVSREEIFGQGILDITKALKGIGTLDANRLSDKDVIDNYKNEDKAVYYMLDTKDNDAEFSNDINQRKWEADTHRNDALNLPKNLDGLNVGFIKNGSGTLTMSGKNSYEGATIVRQGSLKLTGNLASNTYVENGANLIGNGAIAKDLYNDGTVRPGNEDLSDLVVSGKYTQTGNAKLILDFGNDDNSKLIANNYDIQGGILQYNPLEKYYTIDKEYKIDLGNLANYIDNFTSIEVKENNAISFKIALDNADKQTINKAIATSPVSDDQTEKQDNAGNYDSSEENSKKDDLNTQTNPSNPDQNNKDHIDDQIEKQPISDNQTEKQDETKNYDSSEEDSKKDELNTQTNPSNPDQNSKGYIVVTPTIKKGVYNGALSDIREGDLNSAYKDFFTKIENGDQTTFNQAIKSINSNLIADIAPHVFSQQESFNQSNMMLAINPVMFNTIDNIAHFKQSPTYLAYNGITSSDFVYDMGLIEEAKSFIWYLSPKYKKIKADNYKGDAYGFDLAFGGNPTPNSQAIFNINFVKTKLNFNDNPGNFESKYINLGANYIYDFGIAKFLSGAGFGFGDNKINRQIIGTNSNLSSDYDTKTASLQLGLSKDFVVSDNFTLTPLVYTSGSYMFQDKFRESGSLFAQEYEKISHFSTSITGGLYGTYKLKHSENTTDISLYSLYERRISGKKLKNSYSFVDFPSLAKISSDQKLNKDVISVGINSKTSFKNGYFISVGILSEYIEDANNINLMTMFGKRF